MLIFGTQACNSLAFVVSHVVWSMRRCQLDNVQLEDVSSLTTFCGTIIELGDFQNDGTRA